MEEDLKLTKTKSKKIKYKTQSQKFVNVGTEARTSTSGILNKQLCVHPSCWSDSNSKSFPPDGGWGWIITLSAFFINVIILGMHNSFGILYLALIETFNSSLSLTALVSSFGIFGLTVFAPLSGYLGSVLGCRFIGIIGGIVAACGLFASSFSPNLTLLFVCYGAGFGIGSSLIYSQAAVIVTQYFVTKQSLAIGISLAGSTLGALLMAPLYEALQNCFGWRLGLRVVAAISLFTILCAASYRPLKNTDLVEYNNKIQKPTSTKKSPETYPLKKNKAFILWCLAVAFNRIGYFIPWVHIIKLSEDVGLSRSFGTQLIQYLGITSTASRIVFGRLVDFKCINRLYVAQISSIGMGMMCMIYAHFMNQMNVVVFIVLYGCMDGGIEILLSILTLDIVGPKNMAVGWGIILAMTSTGSAGPPIGGYIREKTGSYFWSLYFTGIAMTATTIILSFIPCVRKSKHNLSFTEDFEKDFQSNS